MFSISLCRTAVWPAALSFLLVLGFGARGLAQEARVDLISANNCAVRAGQLTGCRIPEVRLVAPPSLQAVPLRTVITRNVNGACSANYPYQVTLTVPGDPPQVYRWAQDGRFVLRRPQGAVVSEMSLTDSSPWTARGVFKANCAIDLRVTFNEPDVASQAEAQALMAQMEAAAAAKRQEAERYHELVLLSEAYSLMRNVAERFYTDLSSEGMAELRDATDKARPAIENSIVSCSEGLSQEEREALLRLYVALNVLGAPDQFLTAGGQPMSLAEYLGDSAEAVLRVVDGMAASADGAQMRQRREAYVAASQAAAVLENRVVEARKQLAGWLP